MVDQPLLVWLVSVFFFRTIVGLSVGASPFLEPLAAHVACFVVVLRVVLCRLS